MYTTSNSMTKWMRQVKYFEKSSVQWDMDQFVEINLLNYKALKRIYQPTACWFMADLVCIVNKRLRVNRNTSLQLIFLCVDPMWCVYGHSLSFMYGDTIKLSIMDTHIEFNIWPGIFKCKVVIYETIDIQIAVLFLLYRARSRYLDHWLNIWLENCFVTWATWYVLICSSYKYVQAGAIQITFYDS